MPIDLSYDYIADFRTIDEVLPYKQYKSGAKVPENSIYTYDKENTNPVLRLEYDILNNDGFGIKRGFYEIRPDNDYTYLMFIQSGQVKAKIPVIKTEPISKYGSDYEWADKKKKDPASSSNPSRLEDKNTVVLPEKITLPLTEKQKKKRKKDFKKGIDPLEHIHSEVLMKYDEELSSYIIIWEKYNTRVIGLLKLK